MFQVSWGGYITVILCQTKTSAALIRSWAPLTCLAGTFLLFVQCYIVGNKILKPMMPDLISAFSPRLLCRLMPSCVSGLESRMVRRSEVYVYRYINSYIKLNQRRRESTHSTPDSWDRSCLACPCLVCQRKPVDECSVAA